MSEPCVALVGNVCDGWTFVGPFEDFDYACDWVEKHGISGSFESWIATLKDASRFEDEDEWSEEAEIMAESVNPYSPTANHAGPFIVAWGSLVKGFDLYGPCLSHIAANACYEHMAGNGLETMYEGINGDVYPLHLPESEHATGLAKRLHRLPGSNR